MSGGVMLYIVVVCSLVPWTWAHFPLTILHTNDVHARFEQSDTYGGSCSEEDEADRECFGGVARRYTKVQEIKATRQNVLLLDAGDQFQGTLWFYYYAGNATQHFMKTMQYDAMVLGNHEFDLGVEGLRPFLEEVSGYFPVLSANLDASNDAHINGLFVPSVELDVGGEKVGVIGFTTRETPELVNPSGVADLIFHDEVQAVTSVVEQMEAKGINKIIALGHAGYSMDQQVAAQVPGIDIVIGGHSNTFLYTGVPPSIEVPEGPYPTIVTQPSGRKVYCLQSYAYGKYLGFFDVVFDDNGDVFNYTGNPILLDSTVQEDSDVLADILVWQEPLEELKSKQVGTSLVFLDGDRMTCRLRECNMGNLLTDAMVFYLLDQPSQEDSWVNASIALWNSGGIRASLPAGKITIEDVLTVVPFRNMMEQVEIPGHTIREMLEYGVSRYDTSEPLGPFLQVSGLMVTYDMGRAVGNRVVEVKARCADCEIPVFEDLKDSKTYSVLASTFIIDGGDGFSMVAPNIIKRTSYEVLDMDVLIKFAEERSPIIHGTTGRIRFLTTFNAATYMSHSVLYLAILQVLVLLCMNHSCS